jgi:hypothetical protein
VFDVVRDRVHSRVPWVRDEEGRKVDLCEELGEFI